MNLEQKFDWKIQKLERVHAQDPENPEIIHQLAEAYFQKGYYLGKGNIWFEKCIELVSSIIDRGYVSSSNCTLLANALYGHEEYAVAGEFYQRAVEIDKKNALAYVGLGNIEKRRSDHTKAQECFQKAIDIAPNLWQAHYNIATSLYQEARLKNFQNTDRLLQKAIYHFISVLQLKPVESFVGNIYKDLGELFLHTRQYNHAKKFFSMLTRHEQYSPFAHYYLGLTYYFLGKYQLSVQNYRIFLQKEPQSALAYSKLGLTYLEMKSYERSRNYCLQALEIEEDNILAIFTLGCTYFDEQKYDMARQYYQKAVELKKDYFPAYTELIKTLFIQKEFDLIYKNLKEEIKNFESQDGYDGGRQFFKSSRGISRFRISTILSQIRTLGGKNFSLLMEMIAFVKTDSLKFQLWEEAYTISKKLKTEEITNQLKSQDFDLNLQTSISTELLGPNISIAGLIQGIIWSDRIKVQKSNYITEKTISSKQLDNDSIFKSISLFQKSFLHAIAVHETEDAKTFLLGLLDHSDPFLKYVSAIVLGKEGDERAISILENILDIKENDFPIDTTHTKIDENDAYNLDLSNIIKEGKEKQQKNKNVIRLLESSKEKAKRIKSEYFSNKKEDITRFTAPKCIICSKGQREVERLLAGNKIMICTYCIKSLWIEREIRLITDHKEASCNFCQKSIVDVYHLYKSEHVLMCNFCLDLCMSVLEEDQISKFLEGF